MFQKRRMKIAIGCLFILVIQSAVGATATEKHYGNYVCQIYSDGSGSIGRPEELKNFNDVWSFNIKKDQITDKTKVTAQRYAYTDTKEFGEIRLKTDISLWLNLTDRRSEYLCVAGNNFPGKRAVIRVGKNAPITTNKSGCVRISNSLNSQLIKDDHIIIRGYHWPYEGAETQTINLDGYRQLKECLHRERGK